MRRTLLAVPILAVAGLFAAQAVTSQAANPQLDAGVAAGSPDPSLLTLKQGTSDVATIAAGTYDIAINDQASNHSWLIQGPGVATTGSDVSGTGSTTITVTLSPGTYSYFCGNSFHTTMHKALTVVAAPTTTTTTTAPPPAPPPPATPPPPPPAADPPVVKVRVKLGPAGLTLAPRSAVAGAATITLADRSKLGNVHLKGPGVNVHTGVRSKVTRTVDATLRPGTYRLTDDAHPRRKARTMVVTAS